MGERPAARSLDFLDPRLKDLCGAYLQETQTPGASIDETAAIGRALGVMTIVSHHKVAGRANHGRSTQVLARLTELEQTQALSLDGYPCAAGSTTLRADRVAMAERSVITACGSHPGHGGREVGELAREQGLSAAERYNWISPAGATYGMMSEADEPERASVGIDGVIVNGQVAWRHGEAGALAGRLLPRA